MVFNLSRRATASNALLRAPVVRVAEPRSADEIDRSHLEILVATRFVIEGGRRKGKKRPVLVDEPRSILLEMLDSDLPTLLSLRQTSKTMESFVDLKIKRHLQEKFETLQIVHPLQIRQGPSILTFGEALNWIGEYVKNLSVTVFPRHTEANCFQTVRDIELKKTYWHMIAQREFFSKDIAASDYGTSFETVLRSLPFLKHIEVILGALPTTVLDDKGLRIETSGYSSETWHWCPLFDEWPAPENETGEPAVTHLSPLIDIRLALDAWRPVKLREITLTRFNFAGLLAFSHDALWKMRVTKDGVPTDPMDPVKPFWGFMKGVNINMVVFWQTEDMPSNHRVKIDSEEYKLGMNILSVWLDRMNCRKIRWIKPTIAAEQDETEESHRIEFVSAKGPGLFRLFWKS
ncbi:hypothetical protein MMC15_006579 [Xylographa vitiligo]|nr:hypothetical protein [Xylographa vitiligo]